MLERSPLQAFVGADRFRQKRAGPPPWHSVGGCAVASIAVFGGRGCGYHNEVSTGTTLAPFRGNAEPEAVAFAPRAGNAPGVAKRAFQQAGVTRRRRLRAWRAATENSQAAGKSLIRISRGIGDLIGGNKAYRLRRRRFIGGCARTKQMGKTDRRKYRYRVDIRSASGGHKADRTFAGECPSNVPLALRHHDLHQLNLGGRRLARREIEKASEILKHS